MWTVRIRYFMLGCLLVFDLTDLDSFTNIVNWLQDLIEYGPINISIILVGNKIDLDNKRAISFETASNLAKKYNMDYIEVSALTGNNIKLIFEVLAKTMSGVQDNLETRKLKNSVITKKNSKRTINNDIDYAMRNPYDTEKQSLKIFRDKKPNNSCCY
jgi:GTPase SAR1 family protein